MNGDGIIFNKNEAYVEYVKGEEKNLYRVFFDLEKVYDKVPRKVLYLILEKKGVISSI